MGIIFSWGNILGDLAFEGCV